MQAAGIADLIIVADLDESPCVTDRKEHILSRFRSLSAGAGGPPGNRPTTQIQIVCKEIEGWYLAGLNDIECQNMGMAESAISTSHISKEQFRSLMPASFSSVTAFMQAILLAYDLESARTKNRSLSYFIQKYASKQ